MYQAEKRDFENTVIEQAWKDEAFRQELLEGDAAAAINSFFDREIPLKVNVLSDSDDTINIVLPNFDESLDVELTDDQLEGVAGGACMWTCGSTNCGQTACGNTQLY